MNNTAELITRALRAVATAKAKKSNERFFKMGKGHYAAHDCFIGVRAPQSRDIAFAYRKSTLDTLRLLLRSPVHEDRLCALHILVLQMKEAQKSGNHVRQKQIFSFYLHHKDHVNNWDLVDCSAHEIVGCYLLHDPSASDVLYDLVGSENMWHRRIAIVSQRTMIRVGEVQHVLPLARQLLHDKEDLMHKALGWILRELYKKEPDITIAFLCSHYDDLPRTTLRYAIERMNEQKRKKFLTGAYVVS